MHWGAWGTYGWGMGFGWIGMLLFWGLIIAGIAYLVAAARKERTCHTEESALDILKKRFAKGEITKDDFTRMKDDLARS
jgi:putative membrane protein